MGSPSCGSSAADPLTPVDAVPRLEWHSSAPGHWSARRGLIDVGGIREEHGEFAAIDAAGFDLGTFSSVTAAQAAIAQPYTHTEHTGVALWVPDTRRTVLAERVRGVWIQVHSRFRRQK